MLLDHVEVVGRQLLKSIKAPRGGVRVMTFITPNGEGVLRVLVLPRYASIAKDIPQTYEGVKILTEIEDYTSHTLH